MSMQLFSILPSLILLVITIRALTSTLVIRAPRTFTVLFFAGFVVDILCILWELPALVRVVLVNPLIHIILPIAMSVGPLSSRIIRAGVIWLMDPIAELTGIAIIAAMGSDPFQVKVSATNLPGIIMMYVTALLFYALACEIAIRFFRKRAGHLDAGIAPAVLVFLLINTVFCYTLLTRIYGSPSMNDSPIISDVQILTLVASCLAGIFFALYSLVSAQRDLMVSRALADDLARARQRRHVPQRIIEVTDRQQELARLRHDMANQVGVISELAASGHVDEAQVYLSHLQEEASRLKGDARD